MKLTEWERRLLEEYYTKFNARRIRVFNNKHPLISTKVVFYNIYKRMLKKQVIAGQETYQNMFNELNEGQWYVIKDLLNKKEEG